VGGIGSYKLYVMIGYLIHTLQQYQDKPETESRKKDKNEDFLFYDCGTDEGMCLLAFFKFFGTPRNFNTGTVLRVRGAVADFEKTNLVVLCQQVFAKAYRILLVAMAEGPVQALAVEKDRTGSRRAAPSLSMLGLLLLNAEDFVSARSRRALRCRQAGPLLSSSEKDAKGRTVLYELQQWQGKIQATTAAVDAQVTHEDVQRIDPFLWERIRSYSSSQVVLQHLKSSMLKATTLAAREQRKERITARIAASMNHRDEAESDRRDGRKQHFKHSSAGRKSNGRGGRGELDPHSMFHAQDYKDEYSGRHSHASSGKGNGNGNGGDADMTKKKKGKGKNSQGNPSGSAGTAVKAQSKRKVKVPARKNNKKKQEPAAGRQSTSNREKKVGGGKKGKNKTT
jgi:hypothetical protein